MCNDGEARLLYYRGFGPKVVNIYQELRRSQLFDPLPRDLADYNKWLPGFKLLRNGMHVVLRAKMDATPMNLRSEQEQQSSLQNKWWMSIFIPALNSLPDECRTRLFNATQTIQRTKIMPEYIRIYKEDLPLLDRALQDVLGLDDLDWYFVQWMYGQRMDLEEDEHLGPDAFRLGDMFNLSSATKFSIHIALNFACKDSNYSLFWNRNRALNWSSGEFLYSLVSTLYFVVVGRRREWQKRERCHPSPY